MKENSSLKKKHRSFTSRVLFKTLITFVLLLFCLLFIILSINVSVDSNIRYYQKSKLDYTVNLKDNNYYDTKTLGKDMQYIASLIDYIDIDFDYKFNTSEKLDYKYNYFIGAEVKVLGDDNTIIFSKKENIVDEKNFSKKNSDSFDIKEKINVNYNKYNDMIKSFKSEYSINAKSNLTLTLYVNVTDENGNVLKKINSSDSMKVIIPLTEQMVNIKLDYKEVNNSNTFKTYTDFDINNKALFSIGILFAILFVIGLVNLITFLSKLSKKKSAYDKTLEKLLREYDRVIVESKNGIILEPNWQIIDVKSFEELLDARDNLEKPILFNEIHKGQKSIFIVKNNYEAYRYVLKAVDLEK